MRCDYCSKEMQPSFYHTGHPVWWCQFCSEFFLADGGNLFLLSTGQEAMERLRRVGKSVGV